MKILTIGSAMKDQFITYDQFQVINIEHEDSEIPFILIPEGVKTEANDVHYATGGGATNSALSFKKFGFTVASFFKIGSDLEGEFILESLKKEKIKIDDVKKSTTPTGTSFIIPSPRGNHAVIAFRGANLTLSKKDIPYKAIESADQLYITSLSEKTSELLPLITQHAKKHNVSVACNPGTSQLTANVTTLKESLPTIDILILNAFEASLLMGSLLKKTSAEHDNEKIKGKLPILLAGPMKTESHDFMLHHFFAEVHNRGPKIIVVTNGADGVYAYDGTMIYYHQSLPVDVTSSVGAGDAFGSTFISQLLLGNDIGHAIRAGVINSASVISETTATEGLLPQSEIDSLIEDLDPKALQKFPIK